MSQPDPASTLSPLKRALLALQTLRARLDAVETARREPIAIVGIGCRFPGGVTDPTSFWRLLRTGTDAVGEVPPGRWSADDLANLDADTVQRAASGRGGFLTAVDMFDAAFFGISPREAASMDPQQRLLLEVCWEALEHAGRSPQALLGSRTGVFVGICSNDYLRFHLTDPSDLDAYISTGNAHSVAAGRVSYTLGLQGPALAVDTACSSSLVTVHLACQSLRTGECDMALAGGVNLILSPDGTIALSQAQMLAADGRCKTFDAAADGYVRSEGCGIVVLERLSDALRHRDSILAVIAGSAVNQDGRSNGLTAPNGLAQQDVITRALRQSGIDPLDVGYIEAHGTGTALGDPMEVRALTSVFGPERAAHDAVLVGSVKTNLGHLETAAGIAGLIKLVLALQHRTVPPHLHLRTPSPLIPWHEVPVAVPTGLQPFPAPRGRRVGGVSSFGYSGTNAHVVLEAAPEATPVEGDPATAAQVLTISAKDEAALAELALRMAQYLDASPDAVVDVCYTTNVGRSHFAHRLAVPGASSAAVAAKLRAWSAGERPDGVFHGIATAGPPVAFLFTGQGSQHAAMGRRLYETQPVFRQVIDRCDEVLRPHLDRPLVSLLVASADQAGALDQAADAQPALFAFEYALAAVWRAWGVEPSAVLGHSLGEYVAACVAGVFSLEEALTLVAARGRLTGQLPPGGAMAAMFAGEAQVARLVAEQAGPLSIAAVNGPSETIVSGERGAVEAVCRAGATHAIKSRMLPVSHAFHSPLIEPMLAEFARQASRVTYALPRVAVISNLTGRRIEGEAMATPDYWVRQARQPVRFGDAVASLAAEGCGAFIEIGPRPTLLALARQVLGDTDALWLPSLRAETDPAEQMLSSLASLYAGGAKIDWDAFHGDSRRRRVALPTYPFQRQRVWAPKNRSRRALPHARLHPLLERRVSLPLRERAFETRLRSDWPAFLGDHRIQGTVVFPAAGFLELALVAAVEALGEGPLIFSDVQFREPLILGPDDDVPLAVVIGPSSSADELEFQMSRPTADGWRLHASGRVRSGEAARRVAAASLASIEQRCPTELNVEDYYARLRRRGLEYGPAFRRLTRLASGDREALGDVALAEDLPSDADAYRFHPALLDGCLQVLGAALPEPEHAGETYLIAGIGELAVYRRPPAALTCHASATVDAGSAHGDLTLFDDDGGLVAEVRGLEARRAGPVSLSKSSTEDLRDALYAMEWRAQPSSVVREPSDLTPPLVDAMRERLPDETRRTDLAGYQALLPDFDALCRAWVVNVLRTLGWRPELGQHGSTSALLQQLGIVPAHHRLAHRMIDMLREDGVLGGTHEHWEVTWLPREERPVDMGRRLAETCPAAAAELAVLDRCGQHLPHVLTGSMSALEVLFPDGSLTPLERAYADEPFARTGNALIAHAIRQMLGERVDRPALRILEIGAGTGGTTACVIADLPAERVAYTFTDVSQLFLRTARRRFGSHPFITYQLLDIERDPAAQGFADHQFDVVIAANVLHATADLRQTLAHVRQLLAPHGLLLLLEGTAPQRKTDLIFGLTGGWWRFSDTQVRQSHPLVSAATWRRLLAESGFAAPAAIPGSDAPWSVIVARAVERPWLILSDRGGLGERLAGAFSDRGDGCEIVRAGAEPRPQAFRSCRGVVDLRSLDGAGAGRVADRADPFTVQRDVCSPVLDLIRTLAVSGGSPPPLWFVTSGVQPAGDTGVTASALEQATLWGLGRVLANERPELFGGLIDLDPSSAPEEQTEHLLDALAGRDPDRQIAFRSGRRHVPRLARVDPSLVGRTPVVRTDGTYLITGGLGALGLLVAQWLVSRGARHLVLVGRREPTRETADLIVRLEQAGASITVSRTDVADGQQLDDLIGRIARTMPPLRGVVHAAGTLDDGVLERQTWDRFAAVLAPKIAGAWHLHTATQGLALDFFVLFSSASGVLGSPGQANYAAANAFLDALAHHRRAQALPAVSIDWGPWAGAGLAASLSPALRQRYADNGIRLIDRDAGLRAMEGLFDSSPPQVAVLPVVWSTYLRQFSAGSVPPMLAEIGSAELSDAPRRADDWRAQLGAAAAGDRAELLAALVHHQAARILRLDGGRQLNSRQPLQEIGLDSLMAVELRNALSAELGRPLPATLLFDYPTLDALTAYLVREFAPDATQRPAPARRPSPKRFAAKHGEAEPIAIIGAGCRLPGGANGVEAFWSLLRDGVDAVTEVPPERWDIEAYYDPDPDAPGKMYSRWGAFLKDVDLFDAPFFSITPREAVSMDPQQRLLLEVTWEALEHAGQPPDKLSGTSTGVFVGISSYDYYHLQRRAGEAGIDAYTGSGVTFSVAAGRLAYVLGLEGPTIALDTACSSSLVTVHLACQSLRNSECNLALAGGVNLMLSPENTIYSSRLRALSADGRCKTFDARADGYVRGEGCGIVVLKRLSDAIADGDAILAVIRGSAVNQDGRSQGLTAPNGPAQEAVIRKALAMAGMGPEQVGYIEAHGTGTPLGDPIEVHALGAVFGGGRPADRPLLLGSLKTNIGHLESAAGVAGLLKAALAVHHGQIPPHLHLRDRNPYINWPELPVRVVTDLTPWPADAPRAAGISSFGYSGTNAHAVLEPPPPTDAVDAAVDPERAAPGRVGELLPLSARTPAALEALVRDYRDALAASPAGALRDICYTAAVRRAHHECRIAIAADTTTQMVDRLSGVLASGVHGDTPPAASAFGRRKVVFVFPGQGSQWLGMGRELLRDEPAFRQAMEQCDRAIRTETGWSVIDELMAPADVSRLSQIEVVQPLLFSMQVALAALWRAWGIVPDAVIGHSMGEVAAAHVAGSLDIEAAAHIICQRSRLLTRVAGRGAMAVVELSEGDATQVVAASGGQLSVAVSNSARSTVLAGDPDVLQRTMETLERRGVFCRRVNVDVASHSRYVDELRGDLLQALGALPRRTTAIPMYSTVTGAPIDGAALDAEYWAENLRRPVRFAAVVDRLLAEQFDCFLEISPHPILVPAIDDTLRVHTRAGRALSCLRRDEPERTALLRTLGDLYGWGYPVQWERLYPAGRVLRLPTYPWQRQRFWIADQPLLTHRGAEEALQPSLLGTHVESSLEPGTHLWQQDISLEAMPWLRDHRVQGMAVLPAAGYVELVRAAANQINATAACTLRDVTFSQMLMLPEHGAVTVQIAVSATSAGGAVFRVMSRPVTTGMSGSAWTEHAHGTISASATPEIGAVEARAAIQARCGDVRSGAELYTTMARGGLEYGAAFRRVEQIWRGDGEALGLIQPARATLARAGDEAVHTAVLDAAMHVLALAVPDSDATYVPSGFDFLQIGGPLRSIAWSHARLTAGVTGSSHLTADLTLLDERGQRVIDVRGFRLRRLDSATRQPETSADDWFYELQWERQPWRGTEPSRDGRWLVFADDAGVAASLAPVLTCDLVFPADAYGRDASGYRVNPQRPDDFVRLLQDTCADAVPRGIVHLWSLRAPVLDESATAALDDLQDLVCVSALHIVQAVAQMGWRDAPRLWLVTRGAQAVAEADACAIEQAPLWGLGRTLAYEHPELACTRIDLDGRTTDPASLVREFGAADPEDQVAFRGPDRFVARLDRVRLPAAAAHERTEPAGDRAFRLESATPGVLDGLLFRETPRQTPGPGEVEIEIRTAGLNFLDVLTALGGVPADTPVLGSECAGRVTRLGSGVENLAIGQEVLAIAPWSFSRFAVTSRSLIATKPPALSLAEAATIPIAFLTAWVALYQTARLARGERILIHAGSGGVGQAAIQLARRVGAEVFATAGSPEKREWLRQRGVQHVMDSRSLAFVDEIRAATGGEGVDVVLNSLSGAAIDASLGVLRDYGRFVEIGKRDYYADRPLATKPFLRNLSFSLVDLRAMVRDRPQALCQALADVLALVERGELQPIPHDEFPMHDVVEAFRRMAQARHIGKIVLSLPDAAAVPIARAAGGRLRSDRTYLVSGGLGGLGLSTARWLVAEGARHLLLLGRSAPSPGVEEELAPLREAGATVVTAAADVSRREDVARALAAAGTMPPLGGVVHAAGVLDDGILLRLDRERFGTVAAPKMAGAWNLHVLTRAEPLEFFVMYASASSLLGSPGQGNYAAANAFLDALAHRRRREGLPALSIDWGPWTSVGLAAAQANRGERLALAGVGGIPPDQGTAIVGRLLDAGRTQTGVLPLNIRQWRQSYPQLAQTPLLARLVREDGGVDDVRPQSSAVLAALARSAPAERPALLEAHVREQVGRVVRLTAAEIEPHTPFRTLGIDSLMALELRNRLEVTLALTLPVAIIFGYPTVVSLAAHLIERLGFSASPAPAAAGDTPAAAPAAAVDRIRELTDDQVDRLFAERIVRSSPGV